MADGGLTWELHGVDELGKKLNGLARAMQKKISGRATAAAARVVKTQAVKNAPRSHEAHTMVVAGQKFIVQPGNLQKSIILKRVKPTNGLTSEHIVTVRTKPSAKGPGAFYGRFLELGTVNMPPEPFMRPAALSEKDRAVTAMIGALASGINKLEQA